MIVIKQSVPDAQFNPPDPSLQNDCLLQHTAMLIDPRQTTQARRRPGVLTISFGFPS